MAIDRKVESMHKVLIKYVAELTIPELMAEFNKRGQLV